MIQLSNHRQPRLAPRPAPQRPAVIRRLTPEFHPNPDIELLEHHLEIVAHDFGVSIAALRGPGRMRFMVDIRREFCRRGAVLGFSTTQIGRVLTRDHTTVLHLLGRLARNAEE